MATNPPLSFGTQLKKLRRAAGMTQAELAAQVGFSSVYISMLERGTRQPIRSTFELLVESLALSAEERTALELAAHLSPKHEIARGDQPGPGPRRPTGGFLGAIPEGTLVAREMETEKLCAILEGVAQGEGRLVLLAGEPGIGKTRIAQEVAVAASEQGFFVATGCCYEPQQTTAYYPFLEALTHIYSMAPAALREQLPRRWSDIARLLPDLEMDLPAATASFGSPDNQQRLFWQVTSFFVALADLHPVILLLDDLHWADASSLALLQHLAHHTRSSHVLLLGTYRDVEVGRQHPLEAALRDLAREHLIERVAVKRLSATGTEALAATLLHENGLGGEQAPITDEFVQSLYARTKGNPFFVREVLHAVIEQGGLLEMGSGHVVETLELPESVRSVIGQRLSRLALETQAILGEASVFGQSFGFDELRLMSGREEPVVEAALQEAVAASVLYENGKDAFGFSHALIQQAIYHELPARTRRRLHRAVGDTFEQLLERQRTKRAADVAYHLLQADEATRALPYVLLAGDQAEEVYAHAEAERHYRTAIELAHELGDHAREAEALLKLGTLLRRLARLDEARQSGDQALDLFRAAKDLEGVARATALLINLDIAQGIPQRGMERFQALAGLLASLGTPGSQAEAIVPEATSAPDIIGLFVSAATAGAVHLAAADAYNVFNSSGVGFGYATRADEIAAQELARRAWREAQAAGDVKLEAEACFNYAASLAYGSEPQIDEAISLGNEGLRLAEITGDPTVCYSAATYLNIMYGKYGMFVEQRRLSLVAYEYASRMDIPDEIATALNNLAYTAYSMGEWAEAQCLGGQALALCQSHVYSMVNSRVFTMGTLAELALAQGQPEEAQVVQEYLAVVRENSEAYAMAQISLIERDLVEHALASANARLEPLRNYHAVPNCLVHPMTMLAWAALAADDEAGVAAYLQRADEQMHWASYRPDRLRVQAMLAIKQERWQDAETALDEAISLAHSMPYPYAEAKALYVFGQLYIAMGNPTQAREKLEAALAICDHLGEGLYRPHIERALNNLVD